MTTLDIIDLLIAFLFGGVVSFLIWGWIYHQHKKAWRLEYRRLMGGIDRVGFNIRMRVKSQHPSSQNHRFLETSAALLERLYRGEEL